MMLVIWIPLLFAMFWFMARPWNGGHRGGESPDALEIARRSYARGDVDRDRYARDVKDLGGTPPKD